MLRNEKGYLIVEASITFVLFILLMVSILSLVNISAAQARVHNALTQTSNTISTYGYLLHKVGIDEPWNKMAAKSRMIEDDAIAIYDKIIGTKDKIKSTVDMSKVDMKDLNSIYNKVGEVRGASKEVISDIKEIKDDGIDFKNNYASNPKQALSNLVQLGGDKLIDFAAIKGLCEPLVKYYLNNGENSGNDYIHNLKFNMDYNESDSKDDSFLDAGDFMAGYGNIVIKAGYDVEYGFSILPLPFTKLHVEQEVINQLWAGGAGDGYEKP